MDPGSIEGGRFGSRLRPLAFGLALAGGACIQPHERATFDVGADVAAAAGADAGNTGSDVSNSSGLGVGGGSDGASAPGNSGDPGGTSGGDASDGGAGDTGTGGEADGGAATSGGGGNGGSGGPASGVSALTFSVLTTSQGGKYSPRNVGAIWITDGSGAFVKTLEVWAEKRMQYLTTFDAETGRNVVDAVTSATKSSHGMHTVSWDMKDLSGQVVPDGAYKVVLEATEKNGFGETTTVSFTKGAQAIATAPPDAGHFTEMALRLE